MSSQGQVGAGTPGTISPLSPPHCTIDVEGQGCSCQQHHQRLPREECIQEASNALPSHGLLHI